MDFYSNSLIKTKEQATPPMSATQQVYRNPLGPRKKNGKNRYEGDHMPFRALFFMLF